MRLFISLLCTVITFPLLADSFVIKNTTVVDGSGKPPFNASVTVENGRITEVTHGAYTPKEGVKVIDGTGYTLTPGFIDLHAHGTPLKQGDFHNFLAMGVTTIALGQDGFSGYIEDFNGWKQQVNQQKSGVNILPFIGHGSLRAMAGIGQNPIPTGEQQEWMENTLEELLPLTFGLTTGLEYNPALFAKPDELIALAKVVGKHDRVIMSHMRNEDDDQLFTSIDELAAQGQYARVHISHLKSVYGKGLQRGQQIMAYIDRIRGQGVQLSADMYPYNASYTGIALLFPKWAKTQQQVDNLTSPKRKELLSYLTNRVNKRNGPQATLLGSGPYAGKNLAEVAEQLNKPFAEVLVEDIGPGGASAAYFIMDEELQRTLAAASQLTFSSDGSPTMHHPRGYGSFAKVIEEYVYRYNVISLQQAIHKMSGLPAEIVGLHDRGLIRKGYIADMLMFKPEKVIAKADYERPHKLAEHIDKVWIGGHMVKNGVHFLTRRGNVLTPAMNIGNATSD